MVSCFLAGVWARQLWRVCALDAWGCVQALFIKETQPNRLSLCLYCFCVEWAMSCGRRRRAGPAASLCPLRLSMLRLAMCGWGASRR
jgi:hypothetical protein